MKIYLAGPITGKSYDEIVDAYMEKSAVLGACGYEILCPMTGKVYLRNEVKLAPHGYKYPVSTDRAIFSRDKWMVGQCDIVLADLSNSDRVSIGTMMELAWASMLGKHTITVMAKENIHRHAFVLEASNIVFETYEEAVTYLKDLAWGI